MTDFVTIGRVAAPHGVRGDVRVSPLTDFPERFDDLKRVHVQSNASSWHAVESVRWHKQFVLMKLSGIEHRDDAQSLRNALVQVPMEEAHPLPPDSHYVFQLVGLDVFTVEGRKLGVLEDVLATGANDVYVVKRVEGGQPLLIPVLRDVVHNIDLERRRIEVQLLPGLE